MVANAGICHFVPVIDTTVEQWESTIAVNARSVLLAIKYAARQMIAQGRGGRILGEGADNLVKRWLRLNDNICSCIISGR